MNTDKHRLKNKIKSLCVFLFLCVLYGKRIFTILTV